METSAVHLYHPSTDPHELPRLERRLLGLFGVCLARYGATEISAQTWEVIDSGRAPAVYEHVRSGGGSLFSCAPASEES